MRNKFPKPTKSLAKAKKDLIEWGYCLLKDAIPNDLNKKITKRLIEQANAEKKSNVAYEDGSNEKKWGEFNKVKKTVGINQRVWMLPNKGKIFLKVLAKHHNYVNCVQNVLGNEFILSSYNANIAKPGGLAMDLHTDQWWYPDPVDRRKKFLPVSSITRKKFDYNINFEVMKNKDLIIRPAVSNVLIMLNGMNFKNGGTLLVPGSHLYGRHPNKKIDKDIKPIAAEGPPGCAIITDGRLWHGTGANISDTDRLAILITFCGPQFRPQENYTLGLKRNLFNHLTNYQKELLGFKVWNGYGRIGDPTDQYLNIDPKLIGEINS